MAVNTASRRLYSAPRYRLENVDVQIYRLEDTRWTLEVVDGEGTSTVWDDQFETAADAKAEFLRSIAEEGLLGAIAGEPVSKH